MKKKYIIMAIVIVSCLVMGLIDAIVRPGHLVKSMIKAPLFLLLPIVYTLFNKSVNLKKLITPSKKGIIYALFVGMLVFA